MDGGIRLVDIQEYIQRRRAYLLARKDAAGAVTDKGKIIGILQVLVDLEGMVRQLRINAAPGTSGTTIPTNLPASVDELAARQLDALCLPGATLDDFRDDQRQNKSLARYPNKKEGIILLGKLLRNKALVSAVLNHLHTLAGESPAIGSPKSPRISANNGVICPHCGKSYKYAKALDTHVHICPKRPSSSSHDCNSDFTWK